MSNRRDRLSFGRRSGPRIARVTTNARLLDRLCARTGKSVWGDAVSRSINGCALRYILDPHASRACAEAFLSGADIFPLEDTMLRLPAERFWLEFFSDGEEHPGGKTDPALRYGLLVEGTAGGRSGSIRCFAEQSDGRVLELGARIEFDLDEAMAPAAPPWRYRLGHRQLRPVDALLKHSAMVVDRASPCYWRDRERRDHSALVGRYATLLWHVLPFTLAFSLMLSARSLLRETPVELASRDQARKQRSRAHLPDHVEVTLMLGGMGEPAAETSPGAARAAPRLHLVRGHRVTRYGKTFWRTSHLRGDERGALITRTVTVGAQAAGRRAPASRRRPSKTSSADRLPPLSHGSQRSVQDPAAPLPDAAPRR